MFRQARPARPERVAARQKWRTARALALAWAAAAVVVLLLVLTGALGELELRTYDLWFRLRGAEPTGGQVVVVAIDDASIASVGRFPWPRTVYVQLLSHLSQARVVGFDILFTEPTPGDPAADAAFGRALAASGHAVLAAQLTFAGSGGSVYESLRQPLPELAAAWGTWRDWPASGFVNVWLDPDGVVRTIVPADPNLFTRPYPSLSLAVAMADLGVSPQELTWNRHEVTAGPLTIPLYGPQRALMNFFGPTGTFPTYSAASVLAGRVSPSAFAGKVVLVGVTSAAEHDFVLTPFTTGSGSLSQNGPLPGVEYQANAVLSILDHRFIVPAPWWVNALWLVLLAAAAGLAAQRWRLAQATGALLAAVAASGAAGWLAWNHGVWLFSVYPAAAAAVSYTSVSVTRLAVSESERRRLQTMFGRYVSPQVVAELLRHPEGLGLGGRRLAVTVLFVDMAGFTAYAADRPPEQTVARLNQYFQVASGIVQNHGGMVDKFLGDGVMAVFGAPVNHPDHAARALAAATAIRAAAADLGQRLEAGGEPGLAVRLGVASGEAVVGNVGTAERLEYTAIGPVVNVASRLEQLNKEYGTAILVADSTWQAAGQPAAGWRCLGPVPVRGLTEAVVVWCPAD